MTFLKNTRIINRLILGFGITIALFIGLSTFGGIQVNTIKNSLDVINDSNSAKQRFAINMRGSVHDRAIALRDIVLVDNKLEMNEIIPEMERLGATYHEMTTQLEKMIADDPDVDEREREILQRIKESEGTTDPVVEETIQLMMDDDKNAAYRNLMYFARPMLAEWLENINLYIDLEEEKNTAETQIARSVADNFSMAILAVTSFSLLLTILVILWIVPSFRRLNDVTRSMLSIADGELDAAIPTVEGKTEVTDVVNALSIFKENAIESRKASHEKELAQQVDLRRAEQMTKLNQLFEGDAEEFVSQLLESVHVMQDATRLISSSVEQSLTQSDRASNSAHSTAESVRTVANAAEQLSVSIQEISENVSTTAINTKLCSEFAQQTQNNLGLLQTSVSDIDSVIQSISDVAEQTNLLALNATIEAARAGESGKGFAVVAGEVKNLANQTHVMTSEISKKVIEIKNSANQTINNVTEIIEKISDVDQRVTSVASAVEEQNASTVEISRSIQSAANATTEVSGSIQKVSEAANASADSVSKFSEIAEQLNTNGGNLGRIVQTFIQEVRKVQG